MIRSYSDIQQDTVSHIKVVQPHQGNDSAGKTLPVRDSLRHRQITIHQNVIIDNSDTTSVCARNSIIDITFYDRSTVIFKAGQRPFKEFPFIFTEKAKEREAQDKITLIKHLKEGTTRPPQPFQADWIIIIILLAAFLLSLVKRASGKMSLGFTRFFLFRGINEPVSRDLGVLFYWQSTILNFISFLIIGVFVYSAAAYFDILPSGFRGIVIWLIALAIISLAVTLRHITCLITGAASGKQDIFREYLLDIYQSYRFGALFLSIIIILISYTRILPVQDLIIIGLIIIGLMYLIRVIRLLIIFLNRNISIFYLILYLCALEILPVLIIAKYFTGLV
jgi:hypothetical protein